MAGLNFTQAARSIGREALTKLDANAGEGYISRLTRGAKEFGDDMFGGNDLYDKLSNFSPTKASSTTETLHLDTEAGKAQFGKYQEQVSRQQQHVADQMKKYDPVETGNSSDHTQKMFDRYKAQHEAYGAEKDNIEKAMSSGASTYDLNVGPSGGAKMKNLGENVKNYYTEGDASTLAARAGVTAGVYGAGAVGLRYASGGTLTTNASGESDIAGIPFI